MSNEEASKYLKGIAITDDGYTLTPIKTEVLLLAIDALEKQDELEKAKEVIRKLMTEEYGSSCQFCIQDDNPNAMCCNIGGSGSWCCENAKWNGKA